MPTHAETEPRFYVSRMTWQGNRTYGFMVTDRLWLHKTIAVYRVDDTHIAKRDRAVEWARLKAEARARRLNGGDLTRPSDAWLWREALRGYWRRPTRT